MLEQHLGIRLVLLRHAVRQRLRRVEQRRLRICRRRKRRRRQLQRRLLLAGLGARGAPRGGRDRRGCGRRARDPAHSGRRVGRHVRRGCSHTISLVVGARAWITRATDGGSGCGGGGDRSGDSILLLVRQPVELAQLAAQRRVPSVLDLVVRAAGQCLGNVGPLVAHRLMRLEELLVFLECPVALVDDRVQVIVPPLAALLARPRGQLGGDHRPRASAMLRDEGSDLHVLLGGPTAALARCARCVCTRLDGARRSLVVQVWRRRRQRSCDDGGHLWWHLRQPQHELIGRRERLQHGGRQHCRWRSCGRRENRQRGWCTGACVLHEATVSRARQMSRCRWRGAPLQKDEGASQVKSSQVL